MAIQMAPVRTTELPTARDTGRLGLFGTDTPAPNTTDLAFGLAIGLAVGVLGMGPDPVVDHDVPVRPPRSRRRQLARRAATWGAGGDGAHLAWRATPLPVYRLTDGPDRSVSRPAPVPAVAPAAERAPAPSAPPAVDHELEAAIEFATDFSVDLLTTPTRLAAPPSRLTAPVRQLVSRLRSVSRRAAAWGSGPNGASLSWDRPVAPRTHQLTLLALPERTQSDIDLRHSDIDLRHSDIDLRHSDIDLRHSDIDL
ncbi:hypothetical protein O2V63_13550, partial [Modestobacter sp. VKM Ac-2977]|uniref:hypothetical protein n=1 Tax=Modestobacter sp. VKM Ac-2977 TaxID=3004131 RepID=UPI0022AA1B6D